MFTKTTTITQKGGGELQVLLNKPKNSAPVAGTSFAPMTLPVSLLPHHSTNHSPPPMSVGRHLTVHTFYNSSPAQALIIFIILIIIYIYYRGTHTHTHTHTHTKVMPSSCSCCIFIVLDRSYTLTSKTVTPCRFHHRPDSSPNTMLLLVSG